MTVINTNVKALFAQNALSVNSRTLTNAMQQLSTGSRINSAKDDAAGLAIGTRMNATLRGMTVAMRNANDGISMMQTAEGALGEISNMLQRMRDLSVQSATGSLTSANRQALQEEMDQLTAEIDNVAKTTSFNGIKLLDGGAKSVSLQTGVEQGDQVTVAINAASSKALGLQGYRIEGQLQSGRVGDMTHVEFDDVLINGRAWADSGYTAGTRTARELAATINENTGSTGVMAKAYNVVKGSLPTEGSFSDGDLQINAADVGAAGSVEELVRNINRDVAGITATLERDGTISLSNDTGDDIVIAGSAPLNAGFSNVGGLDGGGTYTGYVSLKSVNGSGISIQVRNESNGFVSGSGELDDLARMGFNEVRSDGNVTGQQVLWFNATDTQGQFGRMTLDDSVEINGIKLGTSTDGSAASKANAINDVAALTGVNASARTEVILSLDLVGATLANFDDGTTETFSINGTTIDLTSIDGAGTAALNLNDIVSAIEYYSPQGVTASVTASGELKLLSDTGQNITVKDTSGALVTGARSEASESAFDKTWGGTGAVGGGDSNFTDGFDVTADTVFTNGLTFGGRLALSSASGAEINIKGDLQSLRKLGLNEMGGSSTSVGGALTITTQESAGRAITKIDAALDEVSMSRSTLGAFQNRLTAAVDNLSSQSANLAEAKGRIMDTDYAKATTDLARSQIVQQAATAMLAQANQQPQMVLSLLQ